MKKIKDREKYKRYQLKCKIREEKKKIRKRKKKLKNYTRKQKVKLKCPAKFSIFENSEETLKFFIKVRKYINKKSLFIDMSNVDYLTLETILYSNALLFHNDYNIMQNKKNFKPIKKGLPRNEKIKELILNSGLFKRTEPNKDIFQIKRGEQSDPEVAGNIIDFTLEKMDGKQSSTSKRVYEALVEMMSNTVEHAFKGEKKSSKWHLMACHDKDTNCVKFSFLDTGIGIPASINTKFKEKMTKLLRKNDAKLMYSALQGEFRTQTKKRYRGKGLPSIYKNAKEGSISNLKIISNYGYINCENEELKNFKIKFSGTLYNWDFIYKNE
ncbi:MAG: hypothetical protein JRJ49_08940 [Deltaproteobacteria bacterium]|nr:hypothetical protein [Deltaproteobacteria bacterium]